MAILIVAVMLFTTPHIVGFASSMGSGEATTEAADDADAAVQSEEATEEERTDSEERQATEARTKSEKPSEKTTEASKTTEAEKTAKKEKTTEAEEKATERTEKEKTTESEESATSVGKSEENATDQNEEESKLKKSFRYENDDVKIAVKESEAGSIADGAELQVTPIEKDNKITGKQYTEVRKQLLEKAQNEAYDIEGFLAYDIAFVDENGDKVEPDGKVQVSMEYKKRTMPEELKDSESTANTNVTVMHLEEDTSGKVKVSDSRQLKDITTTNKKVVKTVDFETESFSVFTITWTRTNSA